MTPSSAWVPAAVREGDKRCVDCQLGATPPRQAIGHDFYAAVVLANEVHIQVPDKQVQSDRRPSFFAHARSSTLERAAPRPHNAGARASGEVVAARIEVCTATVWQKSITEAGELCGTGCLGRAVTPTRTPAGWDGW